MLRNLDFSKWSEDSEIILSDGSHNNSITLLSHGEYIGRISVLRLGMETSKIWEIWDVNGSNRTCWQNRCYSQECKEKKGIKHDYWDYGLCNWWVRVSFPERGEFEDGYFLWKENKWNFGFGHNKFDICEKYPQEHTKDTVGGTCRRFQRSRTET